MIKNLKYKLEDESYISLTEHNINLAKAMEELNIVIDSESGTILSVNGYIVSKDSAFSTTADDKVVETYND